MPFTTRKLPVVAGRNDTQSTASDSFHPDGGLFTHLYNLLIDDLDVFEATVPIDTDGLPEAGNLYYLDSRARAAISVVGNGSYDSGTGVITINASQGVDHASETSYVDPTHTITLWGDVGETINLGSFTVDDGADGANGADGADGATGATGATGSVSSASGLTLVHSSSSTTGAGESYLFVDIADQKLKIRAESDGGVTEVGSGGQVGGASLDDIWLHSPI